jgi:hypothetical protein
MDADEVKQEILHHRARIKDYKRHIQILEEQKSIQGIYVPSGVVLQIENYQELIRKCEYTISGLIPILIKPKQDEIIAFGSMLQVIGNKHATKWIISRIALAVGGNISDVNEYTLDLLTKNVRATCLEQITRLEKEIIEIENL